METYIFEHTPHGEGDLTEYNYYYYSYNLPTRDAYHELGEVFYDTAKPFFVWISVVMLIVAALLLFQYFSSLILDKQREIAILKALGTKNSDFAKLFTFEGLVVGGLSVIVSIVLSSIALFFVNGYLDARFAPWVPFATLGFVQFLVIGLVTLGMVMLGSIIPLIRILRKEPIKILTKHR